LELSVKQGALTATIETDNSNARNVLLDNLPALRERLAEQNVRIERFDVDVRRDGDGGGSQPNPGPYERGHQRQHEHGSQRAATDARDRDSSIVEPVPPIHRSITNTSINVIA
jgi:flagellar hook-length control protein FliK